MTTLYQCEDCGAIAAYDGDRPPQWAGTSVTANSDFTAQTPVACDESCSLEPIGSEPRPRRP